LFLSFSLFPLGRGEDSSLFKKKKYLRIDESVEREKDQKGTFISTKFQLPARHIKRALTRYEHQHFNLKLTFSINKYFK